MLFDEDQFTRPNINTFLQQGWMDARAEALLFPTGVVASPAYPRRGGRRGVFRFSRPGFVEASKNYQRFK